MDVPRGVSTETPRESRRAAGPSSGSRPRRGSSTLRSRRRPVERAIGAQVAGADAAATDDGAPLPRATLDVLGCGWVADLLLVIAEQVAAAAFPRETHTGEDGARAPLDWRHAYVLKYWRRAETWIVRGRVAATPRPRTWIFSGDESRRRRGPRHGSSVDGSRRHRGRELGKTKTVFDDFCGVGMLAPLSFLRRRSEAEGLRRRHGRRRLNTRATEYPRGTRGGAATRFHGISTRLPRRTHVVCAGTRRTNATLWSPTRMTPRSR